MLNGQSFISKFLALYEKLFFQNENTKGSGKNLLISINKTAVKVNQIKAIIGAVDRYVVKYFIEFVLILNY